MKTDNTWRWLLLYVALVAVVLLRKVLGVATYSWAAATAPIWGQWVLAILLLALGRLVNRLRMKGGAAA